jgi:hypothetical protein
MSKKKAAKAAKAEKSSFSFSGLFESKSDKKDDDDAVEEPEEEQRPLFLAEFLAAWVANDKYSDVVFVVGKEGKRFPAHRFVMAASSPVFEVMCYPAATSIAGPGGPSESKGSESTSKTGIVEIKVPTIKSEIFHQLLKCVYTDKVEVEASNLNDLIAVAKRYQVEKMQVLCAEFLEADVSVENACELFQIAPDMLGDASFVMDFIQENTEDVLESPGFLNLTKNRLIAMLENDQLAVDEVGLFQACLKWAKAEAKRKDKSDKPEDLQKVLEDVLPLIRFPCMEVSEIAGVVSTTGLLSQDHLLQLFQYVSISDEKERERFTIAFPTKPREGGFMNKESKLLDKKYKKDTLRLFGEKTKKLELKLLYRGTRDGFDANTFHNRCDNKGATLTVVKARGVNNIFGGYNEGPWSQNGTYSPSESWLFSMNNKHGKTCKFLANNTNHAYCSSGYGPTWGGGHDLHINASMTSNSNYSNPSTYTRAAPGFPQVSFDNSVMAGAYNFTVEELEVFTVKVK